MEPPVQLDPQSVRCEARSYYSIRQILTFCLWVAPVAAVIAVALWVATGEFNFWAGLLLVLALMSLACVGFSRLFLYDRIVITDTEILCLRGETVVRRRRLSEIRKVKRNVERTVICFAEMRRIRLPKTWSNYEFMTRRLRMIEDAARLLCAASASGPEQAPTIVPTMPAVAPGQTTIALPVRYLNFPQSCIACGAPAEERYVLSARSGFFIFFFLAAGHTRLSEIRLAVPLCRNHRRERRAAGWWSQTILIPCWLAAVWGVWLLAHYERNESVGILLFLSALALFVAGPNFLYFRVPRLADYRALGVRVVSFSVEKDEVTLKFRDPAVCAEVARLTQGRLARRVGELAAELATSPPVGQPAP